MKQKKRLKSIIKLIIFSLQTIRNLITKNLTISLIIFALSIYLTFCFYVGIKAYKQSINLAENVDLRPQWAMDLGNQMLRLQQNNSTVNQLVIVPDEETFLVTIANTWNLEKRYPILIKDDQYLPLFINKFKPKKIITLPSIKNNHKIDQKQLIYQTIANSWNAKNYQFLPQKWQQLKWQPPGVVITSINDSALLGAVTLAAYRGQPITFLEENFGSPNDILDFTKWQILSQKIENLVKNTGYNYQKLGDDIDTITLIKNLPVKYQSPLNNNEYLAISDGLARDENGQRWAITGWIHGTSIKSVYVAMCSIFLQQKKAFLYDSYSHKYPWVNYNFKNAKKNLIKMGINVKLFHRNKATLKSWINLTKKSWHYDLILINSKGDRHTFNIGNTLAYIENIPTFSYPTIIHFIHSWSVTEPDNLNTVGGILLNRGAYAYIGSVHEPFLSAFIPPNLLVERIKNHVPFLIASRYLDAASWKITTIGDPLMTINVKM